MTWARLSTHGFVRDVCGGSMVGVDNHSREGFHILGRLLSIWLQRYGRVVFNVVFRRKQYFPVVGRRVASLSQRIQPTMTPKDERKLTPVGSGVPQR